MNRRTFLSQSAAACLTLAIPAFARGAFRHGRTFSIGLITDVHHDIMHDSLHRMQAFVDAMKRRRPDAVMQLGDFAYPNTANKNIIDLFNAAHPEHLHVIGNHDTDRGHTHSQCLEQWGMPAPYYSKKHKGYHLIVLNGNEKGSPTHKGGYPAYIGADQAAWLAAELAQHQEPAIIFSHQPLAGGMAIDNATEIQRIIAAASHRVLMAVNGHTHIDSVQYVDKIPYVTINSASYFWVGERYKHESYTPAVHQAHPWISHTCPYKDPLFTVLTVNPARHTITLEAKQSEWVGASPSALGFSEKSPFRPDEEIVPFIRAHRIEAGERVS